VIHHPDLIAGMEGSEDAGVYRLTNDTALIQTLDFFTPVVDDPYTFGQIAAANSLSDVYAMGGTPLTAMNIICFPVNSMHISILQETLRGGLDTIREAGALLVGGHSVEDTEFKYGLSITGIVHPEKVLFNRGAQPGDALILTKPLGTGIINTAATGKVASDAVVAASVACMTSLNRKAAEMLTSYTIHACTDITGFGLLGHAAEMIDGSDVGIIIHSTAVPVLAGVREFAESGIMPGGLHRNKSFRINTVARQSSCPEWLFDVFFDPQTSGGLLISLPMKDAEGLVTGMKQNGIEDAAIIGEVSGKLQGNILVR
jgi:selenide,water dikinase